MEAWRPGAQASEPFPRPGGGRFDCAGLLAITIAHVLAAGDEVRAADYRTVDIGGTGPTGGLITAVDLRRQE